jgi:hypothetical protein
VIVTLFVAIVMFLQVPPKPLKANVNQTDSLSLRVVKSEKIDLFPLSRDYVAALINDGNRSVSIAAVQMPGGYGGSGRFYACSVQFWKASKWVTPRPAKLSNFGEKPPPVIQVQLKPGEKLEVCNSLLPQQQGHAGDIVRFALSLEWGQKPILFSKRFTIAGDGHDKDRR